jgi:hypothetical protein
MYFVGWFISLLINIFIFSKWTSVKTTIIITIFNFSIIYFVLYFNYLSLHLNSFDFIIFLSLFPMLSFGIPFLITLISTFLLFLFAFLSFKYINRRY